MTTLENSYCVPRTGTECTELLQSNGLYWFGGWVVGSSVIYSPSAIYRHRRELYGRTEIPVPRFLDLLHDRIVPWRLEEVGFKPWPNSNTPASMLWENEAQYTIEVIVESVYVNSASFNIPTFTDLLTLIRMLTPPPKET